MAKQLTPEQVKQLQEPLPPEAVKPHPTKTFLSSIKAIYVVERLNKVFGIGSWHLKSEIIDNKTAMIVVKSILSIPEYGIELESFGGNDNGGENSKNHDLGDAYKGATTDALTKICSYLEIGIDVFKGKDKPEQQAQQYKKVTMNNHKEIEVEGKPLISNKQFTQLIDRIKNGDDQAFEKAKAVFSFESNQFRMAYEATQDLINQPA